MERKLSSRVQIEAGYLLNWNELFEVESQADIAGSLKLLLQHGKSVLYDRLVHISTEYFYGRKSRIFAPVTGFCQ